MNVVGHSDTTMEFTINRFAFPVTAAWNDLAFTEEERTLLSLPSGLSNVLLCSNINTMVNRVLDFEGTTNEEAIKKILTFYSHRTFRRMIGDHIQFSGIHIGDEVYPILHLDPL